MNNTKSDQLTQIEAEFQTILSQLAYPYCLTTHSSQIQQKLSRNSSVYYRFRFLVLNFNSKAKMGINANQELEDQPEASLNRFEPPIAP
jgi:hypothetical protein